MSLLMWTASIGLHVSEGHAESSQAHSVRLHASSPPVIVRLGLSAQGVTLTAAGAQLDLPLQTPVSMTVQSVKMTEQPERYVGIVRLTSSAARYVALLVAPNGVPKWLWSGRTDLHGDPGERTRHLLAVTMQGDTARVLVEQQREGVRICGQPLAALAAQYLDPASLTLKPLAAARLPQSILDQAIAVESVTRPLEFATQTPRIQLLERNAAVQFPADFVSLHYQSAEWPIEALQIDLGKRAPAAGELLVVDDNQRALRVRLSGERKHSEHWLVFNPPLQCRCLSLLQLNMQLDLSDMSVRAYTALDRPDGLDRLLRGWRSGRVPSDTTTSLLKRWGPDAVSALLGLWPKLDVMHRRSAVNIWASYSAQHPLAIEALADAAHDPSPKVARAAVENLCASGQPAVKHLLSLSQAASTQGDRVALWLAEHYPGQAMASLLKAFEQPGGEERVALRSALGKAVSGVSTEVSDHALAAWWASQPRIGARAAVIGVLSALVTHRTRAQQWLQATFPDAKDFAEQWRLAKASAVLPLDAATHRWLTQLAHNAKPWMLRAEAWRVLSLHASDHGPLDVTAALTDAYPVVRQQAVEILIRQPSASAMSRVQGLLRDPDEWPMVKHAALDVVAEYCATSAADAVLATLREQAAQPASTMSNRLAWHALSVAMLLDPLTRQRALDLLAQGRFAGRAAKAAKAKAAFCRKPGNL